MKRPAAFRLAVDVCTGGSDKLQRYVCQYFAEQITSEIEGTGERSEDEDTASEDGKRKSGGKKGGIPALPQPFITAHSLIRQINRSVPSLLTNVIPQLEEELVTDKGPEYRKLATEVLGQMLGEKMGQGDLAAKYPATWRNWLARGRDKAVVVRVAMTEALGKIWSEHPELVADIEGELCGGAFGFPFETLADPPASPPLSQRPSSESSATPTIRSVSPPAPSLRRSTTRRLRIMYQRASSLRWRRGVGTGRCVEAERPESAEGEADVAF